MGFQSSIPNTPVEWLITHQPDHPIQFFSPDKLIRTHRMFQSGFPGEVTYAVKANPMESVLRGLSATGMQAFDVASPREMEQVRAAAPGARLHYHNPVRSLSEIEAARGHGIASWSIDRMEELNKLGVIAGQEIAVRLRLPVKGAAYDFGEKFGATPQEAVALLREVAARGGITSMTFHPGTQCDAAAPWRRYIKACARVAEEAGVRLVRLNVGGGFAAHRGHGAPDLGEVFRTIARATVEAFGERPPQLVCEPGRAMVSEAFTLALRVKAISGEALFLNDGLYGNLMEWRDISAGERLAVLSPDGEFRRSGRVARTVFGPTCDSLDRLPDPLLLPRDLAEGDYLLIEGMGAYSHCLATGFNGYGRAQVVKFTGLDAAVSGQARFAH